MILNGILLIHNQEANLIRTSFLFSEHISPKHSGSIVSGHAPLFQLESEFPFIGTSQTTNESHLIKSVFLLFREQ